MYKLDAVRRQLRRLRWQYQAIATRQAARRIFDLTQFGSDAIERICSALILGVIFFCAGLAIAHLLPIDHQYRLPLAGVVFISTMAVSSTLILWGYDSQLERERQEVGDAIFQLEDEERQLAQEKRLQDAEDEMRADLDEQERERRRRARRRECPYCAEDIQYDALKCRFCGEIVDADLREERRQERIDEQRAANHNPGVAAVLSFFWPGLGQMYKGQIFNGLFWMMMTPIGYVCCIFPGVLMHICCIFGAASGGPSRRY